MATLADSLSFHKHTMFVLPIMLLSVLLNSIGSIQVKNFNITEIIGHRDVKRFLDVLNAQSLQAILNNAFISFCIIF